MRNAESFICYAQLFLAPNGQNIIQLYTLIGYFISISSIVDRFLNFVSDLTRSINSDELWSFLNSVYRNPPPDFGHPLQVSLKDGVTHFVCTAPAQFQLPRIPENVSMLKIFLSHLN